MTAAVLCFVAAILLSYWLDILRMLAAGWPWFGALAFVLIRLRSGHSPLYWADHALETLIDMGRDAGPTFCDRLRERRAEIGEEPGPSRESAAPVFSEEAGAV